MVMRYMICCWTLLFSISFFSFSHITNDAIIFLEGGFESKNAFISFVVINGQRYIIKQKKECARTVISVIRDALASYIAQDLAIDVPAVEIIPALEDVPGKIYQDCPASLMDIAKGKMIRHLDEHHKYFSLTLQQRDPINLEEKVLNKWLDETIIYHMTWHSHLPIIVALDIFLCNTDRHRGNLFYDDETDSFFPIDMDNIYRRNLAKFACENLKRMIRVDNKKFSKKEIKALKVMKNTLESLMQKHTPDAIISQLYHYAQQAGYESYGSLIDTKITKKLSLHKEIIKKNYASLHKLIAILDGIIKHA